MMKRCFALAIGAALGSATPLLAQQPGLQKGLPPD
jgi:hypothetical protein